LKSLNLLFASFFRIIAVLPETLRRRTLVLFGCMLMLGFLELGGVVSLSFFASVLNSPDVIAKSRHVAYALELFPSLAPLLSDTRYLMVCAVIPPVALILLKNITAAHVSWKTALLGGNVAGYVGCEIMRRFVYMPYDWHISSSSADAFTRMSWRFALGQLLVQSLIAYSNLITTALLFLCLFIYAPEITLLVMGVMAGASLFLYNTIRRQIDAASDAFAQAQNQESRATMTTVRGIREVLIYQQQPVFLQAIEQAVNKGVRPQAFLGIAPPIPSWVLESVGFLLIGLTLAWLVLVRNADNVAVTASIALLTLAAWRVLPSLNKAVGAIVNIRANLPMGIPCLEYMESMKTTPLAQENEIPDFTIRMTIELNNVRYRYPGAGEDSLHDITLSIPAGKCVGFVGTSGAGKSTLVNILSGLLQPTEGQLQVDGHSVSGSVLAAYRRKVGYVPQNPYLLPGTVEENITFSQWGVPADRQKLHAVCRQAGIDFLGSNFEDIGRSIGENGAGVSGGQAQRVTIARALYAEPEVLIFDEATSSLDDAAGGRIHCTINDLPQGITRILIAHKLSTLRQCDIVYWLENGTVVDQGNATEILSRYAKQQSNANNDSGCH